jgi:rhomboid protease GluP
MFLSPTIWIIFSNILVYLFLGLKGVDLFSPSTNDLIKWGGNLGPYTLTGEQDRLLSSMFLHSGPLHLLLNMYLLFQIGFLSEKVWGKVRFSILYVLSGLFGAFASAYWYSLEALKTSNGFVLYLNQEAPLTIVSVGASGALLGIAGALLVHALKEKENALIDLKIIAQVVFLNVGMGFVDKGVDNACHVGGAISGIFMASLLLLPLDIEVQVNDRAKSIAVFVMSSLFLMLLLGMPAPENLSALASDLRISSVELEKLSLRMERKADDELLKIPAPVSMEEAAGKHLVIVGGAVDLIHQQGSDTFYVPNMDTNRIAKIDVKTFQLLDDLVGPTLPEIKDSGCPDNLCLGRGASGIAVAKDPKWAMVSSMVEDSISKYDLETNKILWSLKIGRFPRNTYLSQNEKYAFAVNSPDNSVSVIDLVQKKVLFTKPLGEAATGLPFGRPVGAAQGRGQLYLADPVGNKILAIDTEAPTEIETAISLGNFSPNRIVLSPQGEQVWISGSTSSGGALRTYDAETFKLVDEYATCSGEQISEFAIDPKNKWIALEQEGSLTVRVVSMKSLSTVRVFPSSSGHNLLRFSEDGSSLYFMSLQGRGSALSVFDVEKSLDVKATVTEFGEVVCL